MYREKRNYGAFIFALIIIVFIAFILITERQRERTPLVFSAREMPDGLWQEYKNEYIEPGSGRTLDKQRENITTSEGESYTMLRAVWADDKDAFDKSWGWTKNFLQHKSDHLFSWLYGKKEDGSYGVIVSQGGDHSASDADTDIALSLIFAYSRWQDKKYLSDALKIVPDIWSREVISVAGKNYLASSDFHPIVNGFILLNPSYSAPYAYKIFDEVDKNHNWKGLGDDSYSFLENVISNKLDKNKTSFLPPDWVKINIATGEISAPDTPLLTSFGFDAMRLSWRIALDWQWFKDPRDYLILSRLNFLSDQWQEKNSLSSIYSHGGAIIDEKESPAVYGGDLGYFFAVDAANASKIYQLKLISLYDPDHQKWNRTMSYYDSNWAWFGLALYNSQLQNFFMLN